MLFRSGVYSPATNWHRVDESMANVKVAADNETVSLVWSVTGLINEGNATFRQKLCKVLQTKIDGFLIDS